MKMDCDNTSAGLVEDRMVRCENPADNVTTGLEIKQSVRAREYSFDQLSSSQRPLSLGITIHTDSMYVVDSVHYCGRPRILLEPHVPLSL